MKEYITIFGNKFLIAEITDFKAGDHVRYTKNVLGWIDRPPKYLEQYDLTIARISRDTLVCICADYPDEFWYIHPSHLELILRPD